ncbi:MAG TPA: hypothetical protein VK210_05170 [Terriglobia bacterium]|nr:hypothetical protein [Terriglobia bacterium]
MAKGDISWTRRNEAGERVEVSVEQFGDRWIFRSRGRRPEQWQEMAEPPLDDWLELLDAVTRRVGRQRIRPEEVERLKKIIRERFPSKV